MSSGEAPKGDRDGDGFRFPNVSDGMDSEEILSAVIGERALPELGATSSELILLLQTLNYAEPTDTEMAQEIVVIGAMSRAFELEADEDTKDKQVGLLESQESRVSGIHLRRLTSRSMVAAAALVFFMGSAAAAAAGSLPKGVQNVVAKMVKAVSGVQLPDPESTVSKSSSTTSTPTTGSQSMVVPAIPTVPATTSTTTSTSTSTNVPSSTLPTVAHAEGVGSSKGDSGEHNQGSPLPSLPETSNASSFGDGNAVTSTPAASRDQGGSPSTTAPSGGSGKDGSSSSTTTTSGSGDSSNGSNGGDH